MTRIIITPHELDAIVKQVLAMAIPNLLRETERNPDFDAFKGFDEGAGYPEEDIAAYIYAAYEAITGDDADDQRGILVCNEAVVRLDIMVREVGHLEVLRRAVIAKQQIIREIQEGRIPPTVTGFTELHEHCDANGYGNLLVMTGDEDGLATMSLDDVAMMQGLVDLWLSQRKVIGLTAVVDFEDPGHYPIDEWTSSLEARLYALPVGNGDEVESISVITFNEDMVGWHTT